MFPTSMSQVSHPEVLWHKWIGLVESPQTYGDSGLSRIGSKDVESPLLFPSHRQLEPDPKSPASPGNRITKQFKNGFGKPSNMAFSGFQLSELLGTVIACHCMSLQSCTCQPNVCGYCSNESGRQYRQYLTCCTGSVPVLDDEMHMGSEFGGDTNGSLVN